MKRSHGLFIITAMMLVAAFQLKASAFPQAKPPELTVPVSSQRPRIDGAFGDSCWKRAAEIRLRFGAQKGTTTARIVRSDDQHDDLYLGVTCGLARPIQNGKNEYLELLIDSNGDRNSYYLFWIHSDGTVRASYHEENPPWYDFSRRPQVKVKVRTTERSWTAEIMLPLSIFSLNKSLASEIGFNLRRHDSANGETHSWAPGFPRPSRAGRLKGFQARNFPPLGGAPSAPLPLGPGSAHPGTTGEVRLELEGFLMGSDPHARSVIWDLAVNEDEGELYVLSVPRVRACPEIQVFDRQGKYLRTVMPFSPALPRKNVNDLAASTVMEDGKTLVVPKHFEIFGAVETSMYGEWWHLPQKIIVAPNGDLILTNLYRGTLWRLHPDGSLPTEGWTSILNPKRNEPFETTFDIGVKHSRKLNARSDEVEEWYAVRTDSYLPFPELYYPYLAFDQEGNLCMSRGLHCKSSGLKSLAEYTRYWEVPYGGMRRPPANQAVWWKMRLLDGAKVDNIRGYGFDGKSVPFPLPGGVPGQKKPGKFIGECGIAFAGDHLILSDRKAGRLTVFDGDRNQVAAFDHYVAQGKRHPLSSPTALAVDAQKCVYILTGGSEKKVIKLKNWGNPDLLAASPPLHAETLQIAIDRKATPPIVWAANGAGMGSLVKLSGDDLSLKGEWKDTGDKLSNPVQQGFLPILNVDPETDHLYVEDDSQFRFGNRGETYRLDSKGRVLKRLRSSPKEMPRLETHFGRDGKLYAWAKGKIRRTDRTGNPLPFKATGSEVLTVDTKLHHVGVYMGMDVDEEGNIYYVDSRSRLNVYDANGTLKKKELLNLKGAVRGIQVDRQGHIYALSRKSPTIARDSILEVYKSSLLHLTKYSSGGGEALWSLPWTGITGRDQVISEGCACLRPRLHQALDRKGYLFVAGWNSIRVINSKTGKVVGEFGSYGNMDCKGKGSKVPHPALPFGTISALAVSKDRLYVMDVLNRRIVKCKIVYQKEN